MSMPKRFATCHPEKAHLAKGLCKSCYDESYAKTNQQKLNNKKRAWRAENPDKVAAARRKYLYGIDTETVQAILKAQDGLCKICGVLPATDVDHNHATGKPRSMLCGECNRALGLFKENREVHLSAVKYLELWDDRAVRVVSNTGRPCCYRHGVS